jgi:tetratricopeptide (TPR) repeat protein
LRPPPLRPPRRGRSRLWTSCWGAHERIAETLAVRGASAAERAHHVERSARRGDATAVATLRDAGEAAAQRAPTSAAIWFGHALRLLPETAPAEVRVELLLSRARVLVATGQFGEGHAALLESVELVPSESVALRVRLTTACAGVEHLLGRHEEAHARLAGAVDGLSDPSSSEAATLMIELAMDGFFRMDYELMHEWAERALSAAQSLDDRPLTAAAVAVLAFASAAGCATEEARTRCFEAAALVADLEDAKLAFRLDAAVNLAGAELYLDRYEEAEAHAERALSVARATGQSEFIPLAVSILGQVKLLRGHLAEAGELLDDAVESARLSGNVQALAGNLVNRSLTALAAGDVELALVTAQENVELTQGLDQSLVCAAGVALAAALLESGDPERGVDVLVRSSGGDELPLIPGVFTTAAVPGSGVVTQGTRLRASNPLVKAVPQVEATAAAAAPSSSTATTPESKARLMPEPVLSPAMEGESRTRQGHPGTTLPTPRRGQPNFVCQLRRSGARASSRSVEPDVTWPCGAGPNLAAKARGCPPPRTARCPARLRYFIERRSSSRGKGGGVIALGATRALTPCQPSAKKHAGRVPTAS